MKARFLTVYDYVILFIVGMTLASLKPFGWINVLGIIGGSAAMIAAVVIDHKNARRRRH
ncbi:MAG: hypothetical protein J5642_00450 [Bacteroidales bacterium]|nr:hypothetical protein [Bacteroidales bacterium]